MNSRNPRILYRIISSYANPSYENSDGGYGGVPFQSDSGQFTFEILSALESDK
jgi:hypothetical protein